MRIKASILVIAVATALTGCNEVEKGQETKTIQEMEDALK